MEQEDLGKLLGVTGTTVSRYEGGHRQPGIERLRAIATALGKPLGYFLEDSTRVSVSVPPMPGLTDAIAAILTAAGIALPGTPNQDGPVPDAVTNKERPNPRHTGIHELLDLVDAGKPLPGGIVLSAEEEEGLRTYGRSGPAVDDVGKACELVLTWRGWGIR